MNAVNLIPSGRRGQPGLSASPAFLGLLGGLVVVLAVVAGYAVEHKRVSQRQTELAQVTAGVARWTAAANSYTKVVALAKEHDQQLGDVKQLADQRFNWSGLLGQVAHLMPANAALTSLQATTPTGSAASGATGSSSGSTSGIQLSACAASQSAVAQTMIQLHRITDVSAVTLSSSSSSGSGSGGGSGAHPRSGAASSGGCPFPVQFQVSLSFAAPTTSAASTTGSAAAGATPPATGSSPTTTTPAASANASASATPGAAQ